MAEPRPKVLDYAVGLTTDGGWSIDDGVEQLGPGWTAEHLVLAGLVRCTLTSLAYHGRRVQIAVTASRGEARGTITKRDSDGRYAFVEIQIDLDVSLAPPCEEVEQLLAKAERDCFVGASLTVTPRYRWTVNGGAVAAAA